MSWKNAKWMFIDTETTGLKVSQGARVWEVGWAIVDDMKISSAENLILDPGVEIPPEVVKITGVKPEELKGKPSFKDISHELYNKMNAVDFIMAYNAKFDKEMIDNEFKLAGLSTPNKQWLDPIIWIRRFMKLGDYKLKTLTTHFKVELDRAHRADADAEAAARATVKFLETFEGKAIPDDPLELARMEKVWDADERDIRKAAYQSKTKINKP